MKVEESVSYSGPSPGIATPIPYVEPGSADTSRLVTGSLSETPSPRVKPVFLHSQQGVFVNLSVLAVCLSVYLVCLYICVYLFVYLFCMPACLFVSVCLSVSVCLYKLCLSVCLSVCLLVSLCLSCLFMHVCVHVCVKIVVHYILCNTLYNGFVCRDEKRTEQFSSVSWCCARILWRYVSDRRYVHVL